MSMSPQEALAEQLYALGYTEDEIADEILWSFPDAFNEYNRRQGGGVDA